jgi:hypothetical protein
MKGNLFMETQKTTMFVPKLPKQDGIAHNFKGYIYTPKPKFAGGEIKWYEDTYKKTK